jgi:hypothetical protein
MNSAQLNIATNFGYTTIPDISGLRFGIILNTTDPNKTPETSDLQINYSLQGYQKNVTSQYTIKIKSINNVSFTPPDDG